MALQIRPLCTGDVPSIHQLIGNIFADYGYALDLDGVDAYLRDPGTFFAQSGGEFWVAMEGEQLIATSAIFLHGDAAEIKAIYVALSHRRRGLGRTMTQRAIDHANQSGIERLFLWSDTQFTNAHRMYEKMGFKRTDIRHFPLPTPFSEYRYDRPSEAEPSARTGSRSV